MEKCFHCGRELNSIKCRCGYQLNDGIRLLTPWSGDLSYLRQITEEERRKQEQERKARRETARNRTLDLIGKIFWIVSAVVLLAGVIALLRDPGDVLWQALFSGALVLSVGSWSVLRLIKARDDASKTNLLLAVVLLLTVLNMLLLLVLPGWYDIIGCSCAVLSIGLYIWLLIGEIRQWGIDALDSHFGGIVYVYAIFLNLLLAGHAFGMGISWVLFFILLVVFGIFVAVSEFGDTFDDHLLRNGIVSGVMVALSAGYICCCLFTPHFIHSLRQMPEPGSHEQLSDRTVHAQCVCGEDIQVNEFVSDCLHTYMHFDWFFGNTYMNYFQEGGHFGYTEDYHWIECTCGGKMNLGKHYYEDGVCLCGHREGQDGQ